MKVLQFFVLIFLVFTGISALRMRNQMNRAFLQSKDSIKCWARNGINQECDEDEDCKSELCQNGKCVPQYKRKGAGCTCDEECASGECSLTTKLNYKCD